MQNHLTDNDKVNNENEWSGFLVKRGEINLANHNNLVPRVRVTFVQPNVPLDKGDGDSDNKIAITRNKKKHNTMNQSDVEENAQVAIGFET